MSGELIEAGSGTPGERDRVSVLTTAEGVRITLPAVDREPKQMLVNRETARRLLDVLTLVLDEPRQRQRSRRGIDHA